MYELIGFAGICGYTISNDGGVVLFVGHHRSYFYIFMSQLLRENPERNERTSEENNIV